MPQKSDAITNGKSELNTKCADLEWLVTHRSINQTSALKLYKIIIDHKAKLDEEQWRRSAVQKLLAVNFSLWRAVFLSDLKQERKSMLNDTESFLLELIQSNSIGFVQDRKTNAWTFRY